MASARDKALGLPELLETILLELPTFKVLLAQRVCRHWCALIQTSPAIQQTLFLKPTAPPVPPSTLIPAVPSSYRGHVQYDRYLRLNNSFLTFINSFANGPSGQTPNKVENRDQSIPVSIGMTRATQRPRTAEAFSNMSFSSIYITDPPCTMARIIILRRLVRGGFEEASLRNESGLRCRDIIEVAERMLRGSGSEQSLLIGKVPVIVTFRMVISNEEAEAWEEDWKRQIDLAQAKKSKEGTK